MELKTYYVYVLRCSDGTFYTGITTNLQRRIEEHNHSTKGAKYTKGRRPVVLEYNEISPSRSEAQKREAVLKALTHVEKKRLVEKALVS